MSKQKGFFEQWAGEIAQREAAQGKSDALAGRPANTNKSLSGDYNAPYNQWRAISNIGRGSTQTPIDTGSSGSDSAGSVWLLLTPIIIGAIIGLMRGASQGAITAIEYTIGGAIGGLFALMIIGLAVQMIVFLWDTKWLWIALALIGAIGYLISGKL